MRMDHFSGLNDILTEPYAQTARSQPVAQAANPFILAAYHTTVAIPKPASLGL
jgi:hypothetical protein